MNSLYCFTEKNKPLVYIFNNDKPLKYRNDLKYYIKADQLIPIEEFDESIFDTGESVYEVVRIQNGKALFLVDHLKRMQRSLDLIYGNFQCSKSALEDDLRLLVQANKITEGNIKMELRKKDEGFLRLLYFIPHRYPSQEQINNGIRMRFQFNERPNPNAKISNWKVRGNANSIIDEHQIYETLLVNSEGFITEGSRSNIFFIKEGQLFSAPEKWILPGITRAKVLAICKVQGIEVLHQKIHHTKLSQFDAAFITGTSPGVLQIREIEDVEFEINNNIYTQILKAYFKLLQS
jgi:branched-chain amino acid aminotransferase